MECEMCKQEGKVGDSAETLELLSKCHFNAPLRLVREGDIIITFCYLPECGREVARFEVK